MNPTKVNALFTQDSPLTEAEKNALNELEFMDLMHGNGVELTPFGEPNREFIKVLFARHGVTSYRLSL